MTPDDEIFVAGALKELAQHLKEYPKDDPIKLAISIKPLGDEQDLTKKVDAILNDPSYTFSNCAGAIPYSFFKEGIFKEGVPPKLLVYCRPDSQVAKAAKSEAARMNKVPPCWGATNSHFAAAYPPKDQLKRKFTIWHETVHLLLLRDDNRDECYEPYYPCECDTCIMQYEPPKKWVGEWSLCDKIIGFLRDLSKNCRENKKG